MGFAFRKVSLRKEALIFLEFKTTKPSKLAAVQTIEGSYGDLNSEIKSF
jgi:hypothetical protein